MDKKLSDLNKAMQTLISRKDSFEDGKKKLFEMRSIMFDDILKIQKTIPESEFSKMPFKNANGNHNTSIAWSLWHTFRIEDIVVNTLIQNNKQIFETGKFKTRIGSKIITTANEISHEEIEVFSKKLNVSELVKYAEEVRNASEVFVANLEFSDIKRKFTEEDKQRLVKSKCVDPSEEWLIDYWCAKDVLGIIKMPLSRHWIMHVEAMNRIKEKLLLK